VYEAIQKLNRKGILLLYRHD